MDERNVRALVSTDGRTLDAAALAGGGYVIAWISSGSDGDDWGVYVQRYCADGARLGCRFRVNTSRIDDRTGVQVVELADGSFVVAWTKHPASADKTVTRHFAADGTPLSGERPLRAARTVCA